jgi:thiamine-phosphate pyrophosphorylase
MEIQFTPSAYRAITEAAAWSSGEGPPELEAPALVLGLLAETECRAALALTGCGIDVEAVLRRWPRLKRCRPPVPSDDWPALELLSPEELRKRLPRFSDELSAAMHAVRRRMAGQPRPLTYSTDDLLLGLAATGKEVAQWLRRQGIKMEPLEADIQHRSGVPTDPAGSENSLPLDTWALWDEGGGGKAEDTGVGEVEGETNRPARRPPSPAPLHPSATAVLRVLDAAANRAREGLRVVEDYVRFVLEDRHLTAGLKRLRHELSQALAPIPLTDRLAARETQTDVGTSLTVEAERSRPDLGSVLAAGFSRLQEALRSVEEFAKLLDPVVAEAVKQLRYQSYTLQRGVQGTVSSLDRLGHARLYVLIDGGPSLEAFSALVGVLVAAGVHVVQLRDKRLDDRRLLQRAARLRELTRDTPVLAIVNDRPDLAVLCGADGVHVGQDDLPVRDARALVGPRALVGVSTHSLPQARQAVIDGADYLGVGPTFPSSTKEFPEFPGLELLRAVAEEIRLPAFALGGITAENLPQVLAAGFWRIATSAAVAQAADPGQAVRELLARMTAGGHG